MKINPEQYPKCPECGIRMNHLESASKFKCGTCGHEYLIKSTYTSLKALKRLASGEDVKVKYLIREEKK